MLCSDGKLPAMSAPATLSGNSAARGPAVTDGSEAAVRLLFCGHFDSGTGGYQELFASGFEKLGLRVTRMAHPALGAHRRYYRSTGRFHMVSPRQWFHLTKNLLRQIRKHRIQVVLMMGSNYWMGPTTLRLIRSRGCRVALWEGNLGFTAGYQVDALQLLDLVIVHDSYILPFLERMVRHPSVLMVRQAYAAPEVFSPPAAEAVLSSPYNDPVSFVGNFFPNRERYLAEIDRPLRIWGHNWHRSSMAGVEQIRPLPASDKPLLFAGSKINLQLLPGRHQVNGYSTRVSEVPLCGGFLIAESTPDLEDLRQRGLEMPTFSTPEEARRLIDYFLEHEDERKALIEKARAHLVAEHHYEQALVQVATALRQLVVE